MKDLSIIILSFNTKSLTLNCVESLIKNTKGIDYEIIVIDNASNDGSVEGLKKVLKGNKSKIIENKMNVGFTKANNQGRDLAKGRYILFLNSDTIVESNTLGKMVSWMDKKKNVGVASCALRNKDGSLQETGGYFPNLFRVFAWMFFIDDIPGLDRLIKPFHPMHSKSPLYRNITFYQEPKEVDWLTGAFLFTRKEALDKSGGFDEDYFMYTEDVDLCYRIKKTGYKIWYLPEWSITHLGGGSSSKEFPLLQEYKGIKIFYSKHKASWQGALLRFLLKAGALVRIIIFGVFKGKEVAEVYAKAFEIA